MFRGALFAAGGGETKPPSENGCVYVRPSDSYCALLGVPSLISRLYLFLCFYVLYGPFFLGGGGVELGVAAPAPLLDSLLFLLVMGAAWLSGSLGGSTPMYKQSTVFFVFIIPMRGQSSSPT